MRSSRVGLLTIGVALSLLVVSDAGVGEEVESAEVVAAERPFLVEQLEPFRQFLGKTYLGTFSSSTAENPATDVQKWERALNGYAVRLLHSVNDGAYGGETIFMWDETEEAIGFHYFTTLGFVTKGTIRFGDGTWTTSEIVQGTSSRTAVSQVESTGTYMPDGRILIQGRVFQDGEWRDGDSVVYEEAPGTSVVFR